MKKTTLLIAAIALSALVSCKHYDREVKLSFDGDKIASSKIGNKKEINLVVKDERKVATKLGKKEFIDDSEVKISSSGENLAQFLVTKISAGLKQQNFIIKNHRAIFDDEKVNCENVAKCATIVIQQFKYESEVGLLIGKTEFKGKIFVVVKNSKDGSSFERFYELESKSRNFVGASEEKDAKNINASLQEIIQNILQDKVLLDKLSS